MFGRFGGGLRGYVWEECAGYGRRTKKGTSLNASLKNKNGLNLLTICSTMFFDLDIGFQTFGAGSKEEMSRIIRV